MKLRFKANSLRLRVNQKEVQALASGKSLTEQVVFPNDATLAYILAPGLIATSTFNQGAIRVEVPKATISSWATGEEIGMYFEFAAANHRHLKVAIEKDLECVDGPPEEVDVDAFPRLVAKSC